MRAPARSLARLVAVAAVALLGVACGDDSDSGGGAAGTTAPVAGASGAVVEVKSATDFSPGEVRVEVGETVTWYFLQRGVPHDVKSIGEGPLDSGSPQVDGEYSHTFDEPGTYEYTCSVHPNMKATVTVAP